MRWPLRLAHQADANAARSGGTEMVLDYSSGWNEGTASRPDSQKRAARA